MSPKRIAMIAMSGGVDSSVAAFLTKEQGYECIGCTMRLYNNEDAGLPKGRTCCSLDDVEDARAVAYKLGMKYYVFNFTEDFRNTVIEKFLRCYENGVTPNPCIDCNRYMKFDKLLNRALAVGCEKLVTGHYARIEFDGEKYLLKKALDETKDQSYVLYNLTQQQLAHTLFPLGTLKKTEVRRIALQKGFVNAEKADSQDICFVPDGDYPSAFQRLSGKMPKKGSFVDINGKFIGTHNGIIRYTVGQRKGLGLSLGEPRYVCEICPESNTVVVGRETDLYKRTATATDFNWISGEAPAGEIRCKAKIRYRHAEQRATARASGDRVTVVFDEPQRAITPGQSLVLYDGDTVLGGGIIQRDE